MSTPYLGIDFGTTNTALAVAGPAGAPELLRFHSAGAEGSVTWPSLLYFEPVAEIGERATSAGFDAVRRHRESGGEGRLVQSIKSHLASSLFSRTVIHGKTWTLEELIGTYLDHTRRALDFDLGRRAVVGGPCAM